MAWNIEISKSSNYLCVPFRLIPLVKSPYA